MITPAFKNAYAELNPRQKEAVDAIEGPVMVIAGPGTGKTRILTLRIANILARTDTAPENILALTFTESAAANMRARLVELIGTPGYYAEVSTFHGYANRLILDYPEFFPEITGSRNATDADRISLLRDILTTGDYEKLKPWGDKFFYLDDISASIRAVKQEGFSPGDYRRLVSVRLRELRKPAARGRSGKAKLAYEKSLAEVRKNAELAEIYAAYEAGLRRRKFYDYEDMILLATRALEQNRNFLLEAEEKAQYILVDEHQDTNGAQNRLLELLSGFHARPNLFVVGDEKQAIYRFQGASLENFLYFKKKYLRAKLIYLEENYRSTQKILDSAQSLIERNAATIRAPLRAWSAGSGRPIEIVAAESREGEYSGLAAEIRKLLAAGTPPEEIAVLYRENRDAEPVAEILERAGIPLIIESDRNLLSDPDIRQLLRLLEAVEDFGNDEKLAAAMHADFLDIPPLDVWKIFAARDGRRGRPLLRLLEDAGGAEMGLAAPQKIKDFLGALERWRRRSRNENLPVFFENFIRESGYLRSILNAPGYFEKTAKLNALFEEMKEAAGSRGDYTLRDFLEYIAILREHHVAVRAPAAAEPDRVRLMTAHRAKGLEFDYVFLTDAADGKWGNRRRRQRIKLLFRTAVEAAELERNEDERRLFYMALTRARKHAAVFWSRRNAEGRETAPSQFLAEIRPELKIERRIRETAAAAAERREERFKSRPGAEPRMEDREFLRRLFLRRGFSVSALNNYLECPWKYFYVSLLRLPQAETNFQMYGSAMHTALQKFFAARAAGETADKNYLLARYAEALRRMPLPLADAARLLKQGRAALAAYYARYVREWNYRVITEHKVTGVALSPDVILNGRLDKLEFTGAPDEVIVVDYKVKQPESRNWILGKTADSRGDYFRQLVFYKLLLDGEGKFRMKEGVIDFVEPNPRGEFKKEMFTVGAAEAAELKKQILTVAADILNLGFWNRTCEQKDCPYCFLRSASPGAKVLS